MQSIYSLEVVVILAIANHIIVLVLENLSAVGELTLHNDKD